MSFFGNLTGGNIRYPSDAINAQGNSVLPTVGAGVRFTNTQINQNNPLLGGISPYQYGPGNVSDDTDAGNFMPHHVQKVIPMLRIPSTNTNATDDFHLSHAVDDGDIAFAIRMPNGRRERIGGHDYFKKQDLGRAVDAIVNLPTVNYILRGLQSDMSGGGVGNSQNWENFLKSTGWPVKTPGRNLADFLPGAPNQKENIEMFIRDFIRPLGVVIGSEMQGGQHQGGGAVDWPVDFVATIQVDGHCNNLNNVWRRCDVQAGSDLLLVLHGTKEVTGPKYESLDLSAFGGLLADAVQPLNITNDTYVLNHWQQSQIKATFPSATYSPNTGNKVYELVPATSDMVDIPTLLGSVGLNDGLSGYWHIAKSQVMLRSNDMPNGRYSWRDDNANLNNGALVHTTVTPTWVAATGTQGFNVKNIQLMKVLIGKGVSSGVEATIGPLSTNTFMNMFYSGVYTLPEVQSAVTSLLSALNSGSLKNGIKQIDTSIKQLDRIGGSVFRLAYGNYVRHIEDMLAGFDTLWTETTSLESDITGWTSITDSEKNRVKQYFRKTKQFWEAYSELWSRDMTPKTGVFSGMTLKINTPAHGVLASSTSAPVAEAGHIATPTTTPLQPVPVRKKGVVGSGAAVKGVETSAAAKRDAVMEDVMSAVQGVLTGSDNGEIAATAAPASKKARKQVTQLQEPVEVAADADVVMQETAAADSVLVAQSLGIGGDKDGDSMSSAAGGSVPVSRIRGAGQSKK